MPVLDVPQVHQIARGPKGSSVGSGVVRRVVLPPLRLVLLVFDLVFDCLQREKQVALLVRTRWLPTNAISFAGSAGPASVPVEQALFAVALALPPLRK